jgi:class 3 adenylate cyclase
VPADTINDDLEAASPELTAALAREAATREILGLISSFRDDESPVFDAILESAMRLCDAPLAFIFLSNDARTHLDIVAAKGARPEFLEIMQEDPTPLDRDIALSAKAVLDAEVTESEDLASGRQWEERQRHRVYAVETEGIRSALFVPLIRNGGGIGCIVVYRREVTPFTAQHIDLLRAFAAQAVIAIENARQFRELQTRLEREAATRQILEVISQSRDDGAPVFNVILENAARLCEAPNAYLHLCNEERTHLHVVVHAGTGDAFLDFLAANPLPLDGSVSLSARAVVEKTVQHHNDLADDELYRERQPHRVRAVDVEGMRTLLCVPLISGEEAIGIFALYRREVRPFDDRQVDLVETFAKQAVIAIENVRQFRALRARTDEVHALNATLENRVQEQVGEIERMGRLKRFLPPAVADTVVSSGSEKMLSSHRALLGILFCDIRGFTAFCERAEPEETIEVLQTYHEEMGKLIAEHGAGVDHRMGDGIMVLFNDPLPCDDPAGAAIRLALAMRERMQDLCKRWKRVGHRLGFGVGVSLGYATVGMVGTEGRYDYTASGTAVNLAARLCDEAEDGEILLSPRAHIATEDEFGAESRGAISLNGIQDPVEVFRVTGRKQDNGVG